MRKLILTLMMLMIAGYLKASIYQGVDIKGDTLVFAEKGTVYLASISTSKVLYEFRPNADTALIRKIFKAALKNPELPGETRKLMKTSISQFGIANLTWVNSELIVGFYYFEGKFEESNLKFGILKYSKDFKSTYFCLLNSKGLFLSLHPYFPIEIHGESICLPYLKDSLYVGLFDINFKENELILNRNLKTIQINGINRHILSSVMINQIPFSIRHTQFSSFVFFPYSCIFNGTSHTFSDPFLTYRKLLNKDQVPLYSAGRFSDLEQRTDRDTQVFISSYSNKDSIWMLCTGYDKKKLYLFSYSKQNPSPKVSYFEYDSGYRYFLYKNKVIGFRHSNGVFKSIIYDY